MCAVLAILMTERQPVSCVGHCSLYLHIQQVIKILTKGRIVILLPLAATNEFVRPWPYLVYGSLPSHEPVFQTASRSVQPFFSYTAAKVPNAFGADNHQIAPFPLRDLDPLFINGSDLSHLGRVHPCSKYIYTNNTHTAHATCDVCCNRPHLCCCCTCDAA